MNTCKIKNRKKTLLFQDAPGNFMSIHWYWTTLYLNKRVTEGEKKCCLRYPNMVLSYDYQILICPEKFYNVKSHSQIYVSMG